MLHIYELNAMRVYFQFVLSHLCSGGFLERVEQLILMLGSAAHIALQVCSSKSAAPLPAAAYQSILVLYQISQKCSMVHRLLKRRVVCTVAVWRRGQGYCQQGNIVALAEIRAARLALIEQRARACSLYKPPWSKTITMG